MHRAGMLPPIISMSWDTFVMPLVWWATSQARIKGKTAIIMPAPHLPAHAHAPAAPAAAAPPAAVGAAPRRTERLGPPHRGALLSF